MVIHIGALLNSYRVCLHGYALLKWSMTQLWILIAQTCKLVIINSFNSWCTWKKKINCQFCQKGLVAYLQHYKCYELTLSTINPRSKGLIPHQSDHSHYLITQRIVQMIKESIRDQRGPCTNTFMHRQCRDSRRPIYALN